jgi:hypothetical protein
MILMKYLKRLGFAAIAALNLLVLVGAGTASATTLFTDEAKTVKYPKGTTMHMSLGRERSTSLTSGSTTITTCTGSTVHATTNSETGNRISLPIGSYTWQGCSQTTHTIANGLLEIEFTSGTSGRVFGKGTQTTQAIFGTSCTYGTGEETELGTIVGGTLPHLAITVNIPRIAGGFLCPSIATWHATYVITSPHAFYIGA